MRAALLVLLAGCSSGTRTPVDLREPRDLAFTVAPDLAALLDLATRDARPPGDLAAEPDDAAPSDLLQRGGDLAGGSLFLYTNYDGGAFTIEVDRDLPKVIIGLDSYEAMQVTIAGAFAGRVTAVHYAGYNDAPGSTVQGVNPALVTIVKSPNANLQDPNGWPQIICNYSGGAGKQGGCNTRAQVDDYFAKKFGVPVAMHRCQYGAYNGVIKLSAGVACQ